MSARLIFPERCKTHSTCLFLRFKGKKLEDKGAGEGLGLQRCECFTSSINDSVQERGLSSEECENFDSDENVRGELVGSFFFEVSDK